MSQLEPFRSEVTDLLKERRAELVYVVSYMNVPIYSRLLSFDT